jgi:hypothetical protein
MTKEDFLSRLKENKKSFKSVEELIEYQLPVLQYYLSTYGETMINTSNKLVDLRQVTLEPSGAENNLYLMNVAF